MANIIAQELSMSFLH
nr:hypothetical protein [Niabella hibiscisoli]